MRSLVFLVVLSLVLTCSATVFAAQEYVPGGDNFELYDVGTLLTTVATAPDPKSNVWGDSATYTLTPARYDKVETAELDGNFANKVVHILDTPTSTLINTHLRTRFFPAAPWQSSGVYTVTMDVKPLNAPFKVVLTRGVAWTNAGDTLCALAFGSSVGNTFFPGMTTGAKLGRQTTTTAWVDATPTVTYTAKWYTVKFIVDVYLRKYQVFFGERGGLLAEVTSGLTPWITGGAAPQVDFGGMLIATSNKANEGGELLVDNVSVAPWTAWIVWDSFTESTSALGTTDDPNHYVWVNGYNSLGYIANNEMVFGEVTDPSDGAFLNNYAPAAVDISARVKITTIGDGHGAGITYRDNPPTGMAGNPAFGYRLFLSQDGKSVTLGYYFSGPGNSITYTPTTDIDWTVYHTVRVKAVGSSHKVWLDGALIIDWTDSSSLAGGYVVFYRVHSWYYVDDFVMLDASVQLSSAAAVRAMDVGVPVVLSGSEFCVSGAYTGFFYLEDFNRAAGIKVVSPSTVAVGNLVTVTGTVKSADGEKYIDATSAVPDSSSFVTWPLGMNGRSHGGEPGLSNIALLTRIWGVATWVGDDLMSFCVDDGSGVFHEPGLTGIRVRTAGDVIPPYVGDFAACTGVASMDPGGIPVIRMRSYLDMDILKLAPH